MERTNATKQQFGLPDIGIPAEVLFHPKLSSTEKILYGLIRNLAHGERGCFASNNWLAGLLGLNPQTISNSIGDLRKSGFINIYFNKNNNEVEERSIFIHKKSKNRNKEFQGISTHGYVYIIKGGNYYKIGISKSPEKRLKQLQDASTPYFLKLILLKYTDQIFSLEKELHKKFKNKNINKEWFKLNQSNIDTLIKQYGFKKYVEK